MRRRQLSPRWLLRSVNHFSVLALFATLHAPREATAQPRPRERSIVDEQAELKRLWGRSWIFGGSFGLGAPLGVLGGFAQLNPSPLWGVSLGFGGGGFGAATAVQGWLRPFPAGGEWMPTFGAGISANLTPSSQRDRPDRSFPVASPWLNLEAASEWRVPGGRVVRVGVGHAFLLNASSFRCRPATEGACNAISETTVPGWAPYGGGTVGPIDVVGANVQGRSTHMWFLHIDFGAVVPF